jgi:hypothetical protein
VELETDRYATFRHDAARRVLELEWSEATARMSETDFRRVITRLAEYAGEHPGEHLLVDVRQFAYRPAPDFDSWRDANIIPRYNAAHVKKQAFLFPAGAAPDASPAPEGPASFPTGRFDSREKIDAWFDSR